MPLVNWRRFDGRWDLQAQTTQVSAATARPIGTVGKLDENQIRYTPRRDWRKRASRVVPGTRPSGMKTTITTKIAPSMKFHRSMWALTTFLMMTTSAAPAIGPSSVAVAPAITIKSAPAEAGRAD